MRLESGKDAGFFYANDVVLGVAQNAQLKKRNLWLLQAGPTISKMEIAVRLLSSVHIAYNTYNLVKQRMKSNACKIHYAVMLL